MRRIVWAFGWAGVAIWSLFAALAYWLVNGLGGLAARNADMFSADPDTVVWIAGFFDTLRALSGSAVVVIWGFVSLAILAVPFIIDRVVGKGPGVFVSGGSLRWPPRAGNGWPPNVGGGPSGGSGAFAAASTDARRPSEDGIIDLAPGDYEVRERGRGSSVPEAGRPSGPRRSC